MLPLPPAAVTRVRKAELSITFPSAPPIAKYTMHRPRSADEGDAETCDAETCDAEGCEPAPPAGAGGAAEAAAA